MCTLFPRIHVKGERNVPPCLYTNGVISFFINSRLPILTALHSRHSLSLISRLVEATLLRMRGLYSSALRPALPAPPPSAADVTASVSTSLIGADYEGTRKDGTSIEDNGRAHSTVNSSANEMPSLLVPLSSTLAATRAPYSDSMVQYHALNVRECRHLRCSLLAWFS